MAIDSFSPQPISFDLVPKLNRYMLTDNTGGHLAFIWDFTPQAAIDRYSTEFYPGRSPGHIWIIHHDLRRESCDAAKTSPQKPLH